jgi:hypothetical protein
MLFIQGGVQMIVSEVVVAVLLAVQFNAHSGEAISQPIGVAVIVFICLFVAGYAVLMSCSLIPPCPGDQCWVHCT